MNDQIAAELARLAQAHQDFRNSLPEGPLDPDVAMRWARLDVATPTHLREIIDEHGWPGHSLVAEPTAHARRRPDNRRDRPGRLGRAALGLLPRAQQHGCDGTRLGRAVCPTVWGRTLYDDIPCRQEDLLVSEKQNKFA